MDKTVEDFIAKMIKTNKSEFFEVIKYVDQYTFEPSADLKVKVSLETITDMCNILNNKQLIEVLGRVFADVLGILLKPEEDKLEEDKPEEDKPENDVPIGKIIEKTLNAIYNGDISTYMDGGKEIINDILGSNDTDDTDDIDDIDDTRALVMVFCEENECIKYIGLDDAIIGYTTNGEPRVIYSREKCIEILMREGNMTEDIAREYVEYNIDGLYLGSATPIIMDFF